MAKENQKQAKKLRLYSGIALAILAIIGNGLVNDIDGWRGILLSGSTFGVGFFGAVLVNDYIRSRA